MPDYRIVEGHAAEAVLFAAGYEKVDMIVLGTRGCATAERIGADLIIVGSRGHGAAPFIGSVARDVLAGSERPVLIVRERV